MTATDHRKGLERAVAAAAHRAAEEYRNANPEALRIKTTVEVHAYRQRPKGFSEWPAKLTERLIRSPSAAFETNAELVGWLSERYDGYNVPEAVLYKPFSTTQRALVDAVLANARMPGRTAAKETFSALKKRWPLIQGKGQGVRTGTVDVAFGEEWIVIGGARYTIDIRPYRRIRVNGSWLRADVLERLLLKPT